MTFNSLQFAAFFVLVYGLYRLLPHRWQNWLLLIASYIFYGTWDWRFLGLLIGSTVIDFYAAHYIARQSTRREKWPALLISLAYNLGVLGFFKYFNFFADNLHELFALAGWRVDPVTIRVILPIGISFYTFMTISYVIDVYRGETTPTRSLLDFALFVAFFPHLVAGPILRASKLLPQISQRRSITREQTIEGLWLILWGLFQKMFVADNLALLVEPAFRSGAAPTGAEVLVASYAFAFQIYGDFAGYSNMARGLSKLLGIELNVNFRFPYFVASPQQFWRNWHISLSEWLRDYLYIPLGGSRGSSSSVNRNLMVTMILGGLWHGASWTFVLWGAYQGIVLVAARTIQRWAERRHLVVPTGLNWRRAVLVALMFHVTCYGWLIFRSESVGQLVALTGRLATLVPSLVDLPELLVPLAWIIGPLLVLHSYHAWKQSESATLTLAMPVRYALGCAIVLLLLLFGDFEGAQFIYFQF